MSLASFWADRRLNWASSIHGRVLDFNLGVERSNAKACNVWSKVDSLEWRPLTPHPFPVSAVFNSELRVPRKPKI